MVSLQGLNIAPAGAASWPRLSSVRRFLRSPKGYLLVALLALTALAAPAAGLGAATTMVSCAVAGSVAMELVLVRVRAGAWRFPSSALLTGLIVGLILGPHEPWYAAAIAGILATDAKHLLRAGRSHIFNPAAVGLLAAYVLFATGQGWWGALPDLPSPAIAVLLVGCYLVADRANKLPAALTFLGAYFALFTVTAFAVDPADVGEMFRPPYLNAALFCAFFMVTDPPTSPVPFRDQVWFGVVVAGAGFVTFMATRAVYYLPAGILAGNAVYALWRVTVRPRGRIGEPGFFALGATGRRVLDRPADAGTVERASTTAMSISGARPPAGRAPLSGEGADLSGQRVPVDPAALRVWQRPESPITSAGRPSHEPVTHG